MHVLIVEDDIGRQTDLAMAFMVAGFHPTATASHAVADVCIRRGWVDLVVMSERVNKRLTHALALLAEWRNPMVATILLTSRRDADIEELFLLLPSLHCLLAPDTDPARVASFAIASVTGASRRLPPMVLTQDQRIGEFPEAVALFASRRSPLDEATAIRRSA